MANVHVGQLTILEQKPNAISNRRVYHDLYASLQVYWGQILQFVHNRIDWRSSQLSQIADVQVNEIGAVQSYFQHCNVSQISTTRDIQAGKLCAIY